MTTSRSSSIPRPVQRPIIDTHVERIRSPNSSIMNTPNTPEAHQYYRPSLSQTTSHSFENPKTRSVSTPPSSVPRAAKSNPALKFGQKGSVKNLAAKFDQASNSPEVPPVRPVGPRSVSATHSALPRRQASGTSSPHRSIPIRPPRPRLPKASVRRRSSPEKSTLRKVATAPQDNAPILEYPSEADQEKDQTAGRILFGEIGQLSFDKPMLGYGIPERRSRRGSEGSVPTDTTTFARPTVPNPSIRPEESHRRSKSDLMFTAQEPMSFSTLQEAFPDEWRQDITNRMQARNPVKMRNYDDERHHYRPHTPTSPASLEFLDPTPNIPAGHRLKAVIKEPSPKKSPPLRSSRPRQQVSSVMHSTPDTHSREFSPERPMPGAYRLSLQDTNGDRDQPYHGSQSQCVEPAAANIGVEVQDVAGGYQTKGFDTLEKSTTHLSLHVPNPYPEQAPSQGSVTDIENDGTDVEINSPNSDNVSIFEEHKENFEESPVVPSFPHDAPLTHSREPSGSSTRQNLSIRTDTLPAGPKPALLQRSTQNPTTLSQDDETSGMINIVYADPDTPALAHRSTHDGTDSEYIGAQSDRGSHTSPFTPSLAGSLTTDVYNRIISFIDEYAVPVSPENVDHLWQQWSEQGDRLSKADFENVVKSHSLSRQPSRNMSNASKPKATVPSPLRMNTTSSIDAPVLNGAHTEDTTVEDDSQYPKSAPSSTLIGSEEDTASTVTQTQTRYSSQTIKSTNSDHPSLPDVQDTGGSLGLFSQDDSKHSSLLQALPENGDNVQSTQSSVRSQKYTSSTYARSSDSQQATAGRRETLDTPPTSSSTGLSSRNASVDNGSITGEQRRLTQRRYAIQELITSEYTHHQDMMVLEDIYMATATSCEDLTPENVRVLFGNTSAVAKISRTLADRLKRASEGVYVKPRASRSTLSPQDPDRKSSYSASSNATLDGSLEKPEDHRDRETTIGKVFLEFLPELKVVYSEAIRHQSPAHQFYAEIKEKEKVKMWLSECYDYAKDLTAAWDFDSLIIKPFQRFTKYHLMLKNILDNTSEDHPDRQNIKRAVEKIQEEANNVDKAQHRYELLQNVIDLRSKEKNSTVIANMKNILSQRTDKARQQAGIIDVFEDNDYRLALHAFTQQALALQFALKTYRDYQEKTQSFVKHNIQMGEALERLIDVDATRNPIIESKWRQYSMTIRELAALGYSDHSAKIEKYCIGLVEEIVANCARTQIMIEERKSRAPEYAKYKEAKEKGLKNNNNIKRSKVEERQAETFEALNEALKEELPILVRRCKTAVRESEVFFLYFQVDWQSLWRHKLQACVHDKVKESTFDEIVRNFRSDFTIVEKGMLSLSICNGQLLQDTQAFFAQVHTRSSQNEDPFTSQSSGTSIHGSNASGWMKRDSQSSISPPHSGNIMARASNDSGRPHDLLAPQRERSKSSSAYAGRQSQQLAPVGNFTFFQTPTPPAVANNPQSYEAAGQQARHYYGQQQRPASSQTFQTAPPVQPSSNQFARSPPQPSQSVFSSALPITDTPSDGRKQEQAVGVGEREYQVLFLAASLFDFAIDRTRTEAGYPYLTYQPGEIFDVIGEKGELWLAKNQDDHSGTFGWIWEKHFTRVPTDENEH